MIPKRIHYCWFGRGRQSALMRKCLDSWRRLLPGYEVRRWDEHNSPTKFPYLVRAAKEKKWANMSNFVRLYALFTEGGVYLDTDIEVIKSFDDLLELPAFLGCEADEPRVNNAVYGSERGHPFLFEMMDEMLETFDGLEPANWSSPMLTTRLLRRHGLEGYRKSPWKIADVAIFPTQYFYPHYFGQKFTPECITSQTYTIHYWQKRW